ncbi:GPR25 protein, partial [Polypterus senegalus]|nr:GPR25 protein [Polypterus senegalus]
MDTTEKHTTYPVSNDITSDYYEEPIYITDLSQEACYDEGLPWKSVVIPIIYFFVFFLGFLGNSFVIVVMSRKPRNRRLVDIFVINLAVADLIFVATLPFWAISAAQENHWMFGIHLCKLSSYIISVNRYSNIFFLTCMSVDRYMAIVRMLDSTFLRSTKCVRLICGIIWTTSVICGIPTLFYKHLEMNESGETVHCVEATLATGYCEITLSSLFLAFILPVSVILFCYCSILVKLRQHFHHQSIQAKLKRKNSLKIVFTIIIIFIISWLPFNIFKAIHIMSIFQKLSCTMMIILNQGIVLSSCLAFINSCANPIIYICLDHHFRHRATHLCLKRFGTWVQQGSRASAAFSGTSTDSFSGYTTGRTRLASLGQVSTVSEYINGSGQ